MEEKIKKIGSPKRVEFEWVILYGNPANEIVDFADKKKVDLLIMGSNGLQGLAKIKRLGSVSRKVSERISCPITIIRWLFLFVVFLRPDSNVAYKSKVFARKIQNNLTKVCEDCSGDESLVVLSSDVGYMCIDLELQ